MTETPWHAPTLSPDERVQLIVLCQQLRTVAYPYGTMHSFWDWIFDMEALLTGHETILKLTPAAYIVEAHRLLRLPPCPAARRDMS